jgi:L-ascorbate metabolism protein UlaG (beta-lactamase superfamily)
MKLTRYTHACVRIDADGGSLVIDPGVYSTDADLDGVSDVLVTHEHADHLDLERILPLAQAGLRVHTNEDLARDLHAQHGIDAVAVRPGDTFQVAGLDVEVAGGRHHDVYDGLPGIANVGYVVAGIYHPGDAFDIPETKVETLLLPVAGPWVNFSEALDFVRALEPGRTFPVHDSGLSQIGTDMVDRWVDIKGGTDYHRLAPGESVEL